jgi:hypothetical protein
LKRSTQKRFERVAGAVLERIVPGAGELWSLALEAIDERDQATAGAPLPGVEPGAHGAAAPSEPPSDGDTVAVEITDARGRVVGWTTAKIGARK